MIDRQDRRRTPRAASQFPLRFRLLPAEGTGYRQARVRDLSPEGVRFLCPEGLPVRSSLLFELLIPGVQPVRSFGQAAWVRELANDGGYEVGGRFVDLSTSARKAIERHLQH